MISENKWLLATIVVVTNEAGKMLLIQEAKRSCRGKWFFPAGKMEPGETIAEGALREAREESGIDIKIEGLFYIDQLASDRHEQFSSRIRFFIKAAYSGGRLKQVEDEHSIQAGWFDKEDIPGLPLRSRTVLKALALLSGNAPLIPAEHLHTISGEELLDEEP